MVSMQLSDTSNVLNVFHKKQCIGYIQRYRPMCGKNNYWTYYSDSPTKTLDSEIMAEIHKITSLLNRQ